MGVLADYCDEDECCEHDQADHDLMVKHELCAEEFDRLYESLLSHNKDFGTEAMDELQAHVKGDIENGMWD